MTGSPVTTRPTHRPYTEYCPNEDDKDENNVKPKTMVQMVIGFASAGLFGLVMLVFGAVFIGNAIQSKYAITIMLCVMGIVCGLIILVTSVILGKLFISRKWRISTGRERRPPQQCMQTCSVIHTPSNDQLNMYGRSDLPPAYEAIMMTEVEGPIIMTTPPNYEDIAAPLPKYGEPYCTN